MPGYALNTGNVNKFILKCQRAKNNIRRIGPFPLEAFYRDWFCNGLVRSRLLFERDKSALLRGDIPKNGVKELVAALVVDYALHVIETKKKRTPAGGAAP